MKKCMLFLMTGVCLTLPAARAAALSDAEFYRISVKYGVSPHLLRAISLVESQGGQLTGAYQVSMVVNVTQMRYLQKIARHTKRPLNDFTGSSAGAMGYMHLIPSTFFLYAQDGNGDQIKDPLNPHDNVATAAYFLARKLAQTPNISTALRCYNNSSAYCCDVLKLYHKLKSANTLTFKMN